PISVIDLSAEKTMSLSDVCRLAPPDSSGTRLHVSTAWRWITRGLSLPTGERVRLRASRLGRQWVTSHEALAEWMAALTPNLADSAPTILDRLDKKEKR